MDRKARYLETALSLFLERGYDGVSMRRIVEVAGGSKETLYRYFESKEALFDAIIDDVQARLAAMPEPPAYVDLPLTEGLRQLGWATANAALSERAIMLIRLAAAESTRFPGLGRQLFELAPARSYARFRDYLRAKRDRGEVAIDDLQIAAEQFLAGIVGHQQLRMLLGVGTPSDEEVGRRVEAAVSAFIATYGVTDDR